MFKISLSKHSFYLSFAVVLLCINFACTANIGRKLTEDELVGKWTITNDSVDFLQSHNICCADKEVKLTLSADRKFTLTNISSCWIDNSETCVSRTLDFEGIWSVDKKESKSNTLFLNGLRTNAVSLIKRNDEVQIVFWFGDPDNGRAIYLSKQ